MNKSIHRRRLLSVTITALLLGAMGIPALAAKTASNAEAEHFFIISSVDLRKNQLFLRHPTDVTTVMDVTANTVFLDENGKKIPFSDLRAGNTVYVTYSADSHGAPVATRIRKGPMTLQVLHQHYLNFK
ncbi:MAG: hypothetical protein ACRD3T_11545 [Terriglobia bacterium]